jgi:hypothetical protein
MILCWLTDLAAGHMLTYMSRRFHHRYNKRGSVTRLAPHLKIAERDDSTLAVTPEGDEVTGTFGEGEPRGSCEAAACARTHSQLLVDIVICPLHLRAMRSCVCARGSVVWSSHSETPRVCACI